MCICVCIYIYISVCVCCLNKCGHSYRVYYTCKDPGGSASHAKRSGAKALDSPSTACIGALGWDSQGLTNLWLRWSIGKSRFWGASKLTVDPIVCAVWSLGHSAAAGFGFQPRHRWRGLAKCARTSSAAKYLWTSEALPRKFVKMTRGNPGSIPCRTYEGISVS